MAAVDFGVDNLAAVVTDAEVPCLIYKGGAAKAANQWFNKETARLKSCMMQDFKRAGDISLPYHAADVGSVHKP